MSGDQQRFTLSGIASSPGIVCGRAVVLSEKPIEVGPEEIKPENVEKEIANFKHAIARLKKELEKQASNIGERLGSEYARLFEAQAMIVDDQVISSQVIELVKNENKSAAYLYHRQVQQVIEQLGKSNDAYLRERIFDINSVRNRLIELMTGAKKTFISQIDGPIVVIARYLNPGDLLGFSLKRKVGFALGLGGVTSHTSLLAKSLNLPTVVGFGLDVDRVKTGDRVILDAYSGKLMINPDVKTGNQYRDRQRLMVDLTGKFQEERLKPAVTTDRHRVKILNNIELPSEAQRVINSGADGIGLFRTEYLFLRDTAFPNSEKQFRIYRQILEKMGNRPVVIRTFDLGGDKFVGTTGKAVDPNPFLGWRAIRFCLDRPEIFKDQLKALLRASFYGNLEIMLPMISNLDELIATKQLIKECREELAADKVKTKSDIPLGIMIEIPSAALIADHLAKEADFFSLGTNDLIQYTLAVDRTNEMLAHLYQAYHPAVLQLIDKTISSGHRRKLPVAICGEMGADPYGIILLVGLGIDELSVNFQSTGMVKTIVRNIDFRRAKIIARACCKKRTAAEVGEYLDAKLNEYWPRLVPLISFVKGTNNAGQ
jgi:phosphoenolpyruvate-protein phosphotransferase (PTS system enzyme I)